MKLNYKRTFLVGLAFLSISAFWQVYDGIVPLILKHTFHVNDAVSGGIMALDNVLALVLLPVFGALSDKVKSPLGRRTPFILFGTIAAVISMLLIPWSNAMKSLPFFVVALFATLLSMSTYRSPAVALMPDVTPKPLRSKANAVINLMGAVGGIMTLALTGVLVADGDDPSYFPIFLAVAAICILAVGTLVATIREPKLALPPEEPEKKDENSGAVMSGPVKKSFAFILASVFLWFMGYNAVTTAFSRYAQIYWGLTGGSFAYTLIVAQAAAIVSYLPVGMIASRVGRKKTILAGVALLCVAFASAAFFKTFSSLMFVFFALAGIGWASINVNSYPMVVEMSQGADVGKYTGIYYTFSMSAQILTPVLSGALLEYVGYWTLFPYGALFVAAAFVTMLFVRHGDNRPEAKKGLEAFDVED